MLCLVLEFLFLLSVGTNMDSATHNPDDSVKHPISSIRNVFSSLFSGDKSADLPVVTSFKELPDEENLPDGCRSTDREKKQGEEDIHRDNAAASCDTGQRTESMEACEESGKPVDPDFVQVTRVETCSDTENEDEEVSHGSSSVFQMLARSREPSLHGLDINKVDHNDGEVLRDASKAECNVPMFRTHKLTERSCTEAILYSERFRSTTNARSVLVSSVSKQEDDSCPKESNTSGSTDVETSCSSLNGNSNVGTDESSEYTGIDCSLPVPSIISGLVTLEATGQEASLVNHTEEIEEGTEVCRLVSSVPSSLKTPEVLVQSACSPGEQSDSSGITIQTTSLSSASDKSPVDLSASQQTTAPEIPETNTLPSASSITPNSNSTSSSPSKGTTLPLPPSFQMPALFSGLRVLKKGAVGEDRDTTAEIKQSEKDADLALLNLKKSVNKVKRFPEQKVATPVKKHAEPKPVAESKRNLMGQCSQLLNMEDDGVAKKSDEEPDSNADSQQKSENGEEAVGQETPGPATPASTPERKKTSDVAYETFQSFFGPKSVKKEKTEDLDLEAVKKKGKNEKENLKSVFVRVSKSPSKDLKSPEDTNPNPV